MSALRLRYQVTTTRTPVLTAPDEPVAPPTTEQATITVELADGWCSTREGEIETIVDATAGLLHVVDHEARTLATTPIHAQVAFRESEVANRLMILQVLGAGGASAGSRADTEASLGIEATPPEDPGLQTSKDQPGTWRAGDQVVAAHEPSEHAIAPTTLRRWLAHAVMVHPKIADAIAYDGRVPARLHHRVRLVPEVHERSWILESAEPFALDREARVRDLDPAPPTDDVHARVRARLDEPPAEPTDEPPAGPTDARPDRRAAGRAALADGRYLEALLSFIAHTIATTDRCVEEITTINESVPDDDAARAFIMAMLAMEQSAGDEQAAALRERALQVYDIAEERTPSLAHVVAVLRSNALTGMASREQDPERRASLIDRARAGFVRAIEADPGLAGVYKDLGDLYMGVYEMGVAWDLWALGRRLAPGHPIFTNVEAYEQHLHQAHPAFY